MWGGRNPTSCIIVRNLPWQIYNNQSYSVIAWKSLIGFNQYERWMDQNRKLCVKIYFMNKHMHDQCLIYLKRVYFRQFQVVEVIPGEDYVFVPKFGIKKSISLTNRECKIQRRDTNLEEKNQILPQEINYDAGQDKGSVQIKTETKETKIDQSKDTILPENEKEASFSFDQSSASDLPVPVSVDADRTVVEKVAAEVEEEVKNHCLDAFPGFSSDEECLEDTSMYSSSIQIVTVSESSANPDEKYEPQSVSVGHVDDSYDLGATRLTLDNAKLVQEFSNFCSNNGLSSRTASSLLQSLEMSNITLVYCFHLFRTTNRKLFQPTILQNLDNKCRTNFSIRLLTQFCKHVHLITSKYNSNGQNAILHEKQNAVLKNKKLKKLEKLPKSVLPICDISSNKEKNKPAYFHTPFNPLSKNVNLAESMVLREELPIHQDVLRDTSNNQDVLGSNFNQQDIFGDIFHHQDVLKDDVVDDHSSHKDVIEDHSNNQDVTADHSNYQDVIDHSSNNQGVFEDHSSPKDVIDNPFYHQDVIEDNSLHKDVIEDNSHHHDVCEVHIKHHDDYLTDDLPSLDRTSQFAMNSCNLPRNLETSGLPQKDYVVPYFPSKGFQDLKILNDENNDQYPTKGSLNEEVNIIQDISNSYDVNDLKPSENPCDEIIRLKSEKEELSDENNKLRQKIIFQSDVIRNQEIAVFALLCCVPLAVWGLHIWGLFLVLVFFLLNEKQETNRN